VLVVAVKAGTSSLIVTGFKFGLKINYNGPRLPDDCKIFKSAYQHESETFIERN
jgi:hypothetical protein